MVSSIITILNKIGFGFCQYAWAMLIQSSVLIAVLVLVDLLLRRRVRAVFRYCIWLLVFVKLILPPSLCLPTGIGYWCGDYLSADSVISGNVLETASVESGRAITADDFSESAKVSPGTVEVSSETIDAVEPEAAVVSAVSKRTALTWPAVVFVGWLAGVLLLSVLLMQRAWFVRGLTAQSRPAEGRLNETLNECRRQICVRRDIELRISESALSPAVCGLFRPKILLPASLLARLCRRELRTVLIHELAHIKRGDLWVNFVQTLLQVVYFYNPFVWVANAIVRRVREQAVDEMVLTSLGDEAKGYSRTLIDIAEIAFSRPSLSLRLIGVVESKKALSSRIKHIVSRPIPRSAKLGILGLIAVLVIAAILLPMAKAEKKDVAVETNGDLEPGLVGEELPGNWELGYESGRMPDGAIGWRSGMARNLAELRVRPKPVDPRDLSWKEEGYEFRVSSLEGERMGSMTVRGTLEDARLTLKPDQYLLNYTRERGRHPDNFKMRCGQFLVDLGRPGMYELKFRPKLGTGEVSGSLGGCYALNFAKIGDGPELGGLVYQHASKAYLLDGLPAGRYALSAVRQLRGDNVFVSRAEATIEDGEKVVVDMDAPVAGDCSLSGKILGRLSKPRKDSWPEFEWFVLIRKPHSPPVVTADAYEALTMDTLYVVRGENIVEETQEKARYTIEGMSPGEYTVTVIEHGGRSGAVISRQQSKPLSVGAGEAAVLDFDLRKSERDALGVGWAASFSESTFAATLANGVTVELVGLYHGQVIKDLVFWKPDGSLFSDSESQKYRERVVVFPKGGNKEFRFEYGLMMRFGPLDELSAEVFVKQGQRMSYKYPRSDGIAIALVASDRNDREEGFSKVGNIKAAAAYGEWETRIWSASINEPSVLFLDEHSSIMLSPPRRTDERVDGRGYGGSSPRRKTDEWVLDVTVNAGNIDFDCFYELKDGSIHRAKWRETLGHPKWIGPDQRTPMICKRYALFHEPEEIREYIIKYRRLEFVEFKNVSLKAGVKTEVVAAAAQEPLEKPVVPGEAEERVVDEKTRKERIAERLTNLQRHRIRVQQELDMAQQSLEEVRRRWGLTDLEERSYPHTITLRLNDLELEQNKLLLEIRQAQAEIKNLERKAESPEGKANLKSARDKLDVLMSKFEQLQRMREEAAAKKKDLDLARVQYKQRLAIRDERREMLDSIKEQIEKLKIIYDDPDLSEVGIGLYERPSEGEQGRPVRRLGRKEIEAKMTNLQKQRIRVEADLRSAENAMEEVRQRYGFSDLEERSYPHPLTQRLIRLGREEDHCALEIAQLQAQIKNLEEQTDTAEGKANLKKAQGDLIVLVSKLEELQKMREETAAKKRDLDLARVQYKQRASIRDERKRMLDSIKSQIEKLKILHDDPETPRVRVEDKRR